jgi:DNA-binding NarL/FixJ family response regulator
MPTSNEKHLEIGGGVGTLGKILIVDDHPLVREGLAGRIARHPQLSVCGEAADPAEALEQVKLTQPDLVIIDLALKNGHGLNLIKEIKSRFPRVKMLVSSMYDEGLYAERCLRAGALGYIHKQEMSDKVLEAIHQVLSGRVYLSAAMTERLVHLNVGGWKDAGRSPVERLSDRELQVFEMIGKGLTTRQIATKLFVSVKTVETHRENIKSKLNLETSAELSRHAVRWALENRSE